MRARLLAAAVTFAGVTAAGSARATPSARLVYVRDVGTEDCPDEQALRAAVGSRLGYDPFFPHAKATLFAEVSREGTTYRARVKLVDEGNVVRGARDLRNEGGRCADLVDAMALTMSIAIDPRSLAGPVAPEPDAAGDPAPDANGDVAPPPAAPPIPEPPAAPPPAPPGAPAGGGPVERVHGAITLLAAGHLGSAPSAAIGVVPGVELRYRWLAVSAAARIDARASREVTQGTVSTSYVAGALAPCVTSGIVLGCVVLTVGSLTAGARGITTPREAFAAHVLVGPRFGIAVPIGAGFDLRAHLDLLFAATPQILRIDDQDVYSLPTATGSLGLGVGFRAF